MNQYEHIEEVEKNIDEIEVVEKFNPFHDARGRFASSNGFASYSANPKTKAGAMAINRSNNAGHGRTLNVHRESKGESIQQNANWLATGQKPKTPAAVSRARYQQRKLKQQQAQQAAGGAAATKPNQAKPSTKKPAQKPADPDRKAVDGTDLVAKLGAAKVKNMTTDQILKAQGMDGKPKMAKTDAEIASAIKNGMNIGVRSWRGADAATRAAYDDQLKNGSFYTKCDGGNALGRGMYVAVSTPATQSLKAGRGSINKGNIDYSSAMNQSAPYGDWHVNMVIDKSAKLVSYKDAVSMARKDGLRSSGWSDTDSVDFDVGAYAAAKGYDGVIMSGKTGTISDNPNMRGEYVNMVNRTKVTIIDRSGDRSAGDLRATTNVTGKWGSINPNSI